MEKKYPIKLLNGNIESTVGVVKKGLEVQEHTVKVMNGLCVYSQLVFLESKWPFLWTIKSCQFWLNSFLGLQESKNTRIKIDEPSEIWIKNIKDFCQCFTVSIILSK